MWYKKRTARYQPFFPLNRPCETGKEPTLNLVTAPYAFCLAPQRALVFLGQQRSLSTRR